MCNIVLLSDSYEYQIEMPAARSESLIMDELIVLLETYKQALIDEEALIDKQALIDEEGRA